LDGWRKPYASEFAILAETRRAIAKMYSEDSLSLSKQEFFDLLSANAGQHVALIGIRISYRAENRIEKNSMP